MKIKPNPNIVEYTDTYTFKYNSDNDSIDLNSLLLSQLHFSTVLNEIKNEIAGGADLSIRIRPLAKGSVPFDIVLNVSWIANLLSAENVTYAAGIVTMLVGVINIRKFLKGRKPDTVIENKSEITLRIGDKELTVKTETYRLTEKNALLDKALEKAFEAIERDESTTGIEILDQEKTALIAVPREDFSSFTAPSEIFENLIRREEPTQERLTIFKIVFEKGFKWQFYFSGRKITASIKDDEFMDRVNKGEPFAKGDVLIVQLEKEKIFDKTMDIFIEKDFSVLKVIDHIPRASEGQEPLFPEV